MGIDDFLLAVGLAMVVSGLVALVLSVHNMGGNNEDRR